MRYEIHTGKFGQYFYDTLEDKNMPLATALDLLNRPAPEVHGVERGGRR